MSRKPFQIGKHLLTRTSIWVLSLLLVFSANAATAADAIFHQAIALQWAGQHPAPLAEGQEQAGPNNDLHHGERKALAHKNISARTPLPLQAVTPPAAATVDRHWDNHQPGGALTRPAYYRFLFRYKPF